MKLPASFRREQILKEALKFVRRHGYPAVTCEAVGKAAGCSYNTVRRQWSNRTKLAVAIRDYAGDVGDTELYEAGKRATQ
jgi:AcrR family transcriptional regulator